MDLNIKYKGLPAFLGCVLLASVSHAHHSFYAYFDFRGRVTVEGVITDVRIANPHSRISMEVENDRGKLETWQIETGQAASLARNGWTKDTVPLGSKATALGFPAHSGGPIMTLILLTFEDGREVRGNVDRYLQPSEVD